MNVNVWWSKEKIGVWMLYGEQMNESIFLLIFHSISFIEKCFHFKTKLSLMIQFWPIMIIARCNRENLICPISLVSLSLPSLFSSRLYRQMNSFQSMKNCLGNFVFIRYRNNWFEPMNKFKFSRKKNLPKFISKPNWMIPLHFNMLYCSIEKNWNFTNEISWICFAILD